MMQEQSDLLVSGGTVVTQNQTRAIGQADRIGSLELGKQADLFILDPLQARATPVFDPIASLVYSAGAGSVDTVVVAGQVLLDEGRITAVDERAVLVECQECGLGTCWKCRHGSAVCGAVISEWLRLRAGGLARRSEQRASTDPGAHNAPDGADVPGAGPGGPGCGASEGVTGGELEVVRFQSVSRGQKGRCRLTIRDLVACQGSFDG